MTDGRKGRRIDAHHNSSDFVEPYERRKQRKVLERAALAAAAAAETKKRGRPQVIAKGSEAEATLRRMWADGAMIKVIAEVLGVNEKSVKNARRRFNLRRRRPDLGKGTELAVIFDPETMKMLRAGATRQGSTRAEYIRWLVRRDAGV